jgi:hypothetical protein
MLPIVEIPCAATRRDLAPPLAEMHAAAREKWSSSLPSISVPLTPDLDDGEERRGRTAARPKRERENGGHGVEKARGRIGGR